jgi:hypothetical protein
MITAATVEVVKHNHGCDKKFSWRLLFEIKTGGIGCTFVAKSPYECSLERWRAMAQGNGRIDLYRGIDGTGTLCAKNGHYVFKVCHSGAVQLKVKVPIERLATGLDSALDDAIARNYWFDSF